MYGSVGATGLMIGVSEGSSTIIKALFDFLLLFGLGSH